MFYRLFPKNFIASSDVHNACIGCYKSILVPVRFRLYIGVHGILQVLISSDVLVDGGSKAFPARMFV